MRPIVINARAAVRRELGGVERWAAELARRLPDLRPSRYVVARPPRAFAHRAGHAWEQLVLPPMARRAGARLLLSPANSAPLAWPGNVLVLHDVAALREPGWYSRAYVELQRRLLAPVTRRAVHVVTVSEFSATEIEALLGVPRDRITVVPGGVAEHFSPDADAEAAAAALGITGPYVLTVASATARKNTSALAALARAMSARGIEVVLAGGHRPQFRDDRPASDGVRRLGHVDERLLPGLYAGAQAYVLPSLHEGFGLTCLEAMASGTPVVASDRGALPDTCGDAALLADPGDPGAFADAMERVLEDGALRRRLCDAGRLRAARFGWDRTASAVDRLLEELDFRSGSLA